MISCEEKFIEPSGAQPGATLTISPVQFNWVSFYPLSANRLFAVRQVHLTPSLFIYVLCSGHWSSANSFRLI